MVDKDIIQLSSKELKRLEIINKVLSGHITQKEASKFLCLSNRQVRRIVKRIRDMPSQQGQGQVTVIYLPT